jgi:hypothetical protein
MKQVYGTKIRFLSNIYIYIYIYIYIKEVYAL